jgi:hypothetical protein
VVPVNGFGLGHGLGLVLGSGLMKMMGLFDWLEFPLGLGSILYSVKSGLLWGFDSI